MHPLRRLPQRLPRLPQDGRRRVRAGLLGADGGGARAAAGRAASKAPTLPHASSLCGACTEACPVKIPLHELLLELRRDLVEQRRRAAGASGSRFTLWSYAWSSAGGLPALDALARLGQPLAGARRAGQAWASGRTLPRFGRRYRDRADERAWSTSSSRTPRPSASRPPRRGAEDSRARASRGASTGSPTRAASSSQPRRRSRAPRSLLPDVHVTLRARGRDPAPVWTSSSPHSATICRARSRSSPARAGAPTSSRSSPSASTGPARCTSCCCPTDQAG